MEESSINPPHHGTPLLRILALLFFALLIAVISSLTTYYLLNRQSQPQPHIYQQPAAEVEPTVKSALSSLQPQDLVNQIHSKIQKDAQLGPLIKKVSENKRVWWISKDGWNILVDGAVGITLSAPVSEEKHLVYIDKVDFPESLAFQKTVGVIMKENDLALDPGNSSASTSDKKYFDYVQAYQGRGLMCTAVTDPDTYGGIEDGRKNMYVTCVTQRQYEDAYNFQLPFLKGIGQKDQVITNVKLIGVDKATMQLGKRRTGAMAFMYKSGDEWKFILAAQGVPACSELENKKIPKQYWLSCMDSLGNLQKGNF